MTAPPRTRRVAPVFVVVLAWTGVAASASAQTLDELRDALRDNVRDSGLASQLGGFGAFAAMPGVSAATFRADGGDGPDAELRRLILPVSREIDAVRALGGALYVEGTLGFSRLTADLAFDPGGPAETDVDSAITAYTGLAGVGLAYAVAPGTTLRPVALLGYSRIEDDSDLSGPGADAVEAVADGVLFGFTVDDLLWGGAIELAHRRALDDGLRFSGRARYNHLWTHAISASDDALEGDGDFGVATAAAALDGPLGAEIGGRPLRWTLFAAGAWLPGDAANSVGFDRFAEFGGGLGIVERDLAPGVEGVSVRASAIVGPDVTGFSLGVQFEF